MDQNKKEVVSTDRDIFICAAYIPPSESPYYNENSFSILEDEISFYQTQRNMLIRGDLNARTGTEPDLITAQGDRSTSPLLSFTSEQEHLLQLCCMLGLNIVSSRLRGDPLVSTHSSPLGNSTVDYPPVSSEASGCCHDR